MKNNILKLISCICVGVMCISGFTGCSTEKVKEQVSTSLADKTSSADVAASSQAMEMKGKLKLLGPGWPTALENSEDPVTKVKTIGFHSVIEAFNAAYPEIELDIEAIPWDSWQAKLQTGGQR